MRLFLAVLFPALLCAQTTLITPVTILPKADLSSVGVLRWRDLHGNVVGFQPPATVGSSSLVWTLPAADGAGPLLSSGAGVLSFGTLSGSTHVFATVSGVLTNGDCVSIDATGNLVDAGAACGSGGGGGGAVTSVGLAAPSIFTVSGSPVITSGTLTFALNSQSANLIFASPNGASGTPAFRSLVAADLPGVLWTPAGGGAIYYNGGNVAVGGSTATYPLTVSGTSGFNGFLIGTNSLIGTAGSGYLRYDGMNTVLNATDSGSLYLGTDQGQNVYVGPSGRLTLSSSSFVSAVPMGIGGAPVSGRSFGLEGSGSLQGIVLDTNGQQWYVDNRGNSDTPNNRLAISAGVSDLLTILANGNVGIGQNNPQAALHIGAASPTTAAYGIQFGGDSSANLYRSAAATIRTDAALAVGGHTVFEGVTSTGATGTGNLVYASSPSLSTPTFTGTSNLNGFLIGTNTLIGTGGSGYLRFDGNNVVLNGTSSGSIFLGFDQGVNVNIGPGPRAQSSSSGFGIGTTSQTHSLEVLSSATVATTIQGSSAGAIGIGSYLGVGFLAGYTSSAATGGAPLILQPVFGSVGIGTTSPATLLDVAGAATAQSFCLGTNCLSGSWPVITAYTGATASLTTSQSLPASTITAVKFDGAVDPSTVYNPATGHFGLVTPGFYRAVAHIVLGSLSSGAAYSIGIYINGTLTSPVTGGSAVSGSGAADVEFTFNTAVSGSDVYFGVIQFGTGSASIVGSASANNYSIGAVDPIYLPYVTGGGGGNATAIQGRNVSSAAPTTGQALAWNGAVWIPTTISGAGAPGGDLGGASLGSAVVIGLQTMPVSSATPSNGQCLVFSSGAWTPTACPGTTGGGVASVFGRTGNVAAVSGDYNFSQIGGTISASQVPGLLGDTIGYINSTTVIKIQGVAVSTTPPSSGDCLVYTSTWGPGACVSGGAVTSFNTRTGAVLPRSGDYTAADITNAVSTAGSYANPAWITSLDATKVLGTFSSLSASSISAGSLTATSYVNADVMATTTSMSSPLFIAGSAPGVTVTLTCNATANPNLSLTIVGGIITAAACP